MSSFLLCGLIVLLVPCLCLGGGGIGGWTKLSMYPVCFEGQANRYGHFTYMGDSKLVAAMKLVYLSGNIRCVKDTAYNSHWGCHHYSSYINYPLNVVITDQENNILYPESSFFKNAGLWYYYPGTDDLVTNELVFVNYGIPFWLEQHRQLRVWYGEDLKNWNEGDNQGRVCVAVFAKFYD